MYLKLFSSIDYVLNRLYL